MSTDSTPETITIQLTKGFETTVDAIDSDLAAFKWHAVISHQAVYASRATYNGKKQTMHKMHRVILERVLNRPLLREELVDHWNGNGLDNRRENLRLTDNVGNTRNAQRRKDNTSGYKGVSFNKKSGKWVARIWTKEKRLYLGCFITPELAFVAYCQAAKEHHREFARFE